MYQKGFEAGREDMFREMEENVHDSWERTLMKGRNDKKIQPETQS